jgi:arylsulfatase A
MISPMPYVCPMLKSYENALTRKKLFMKNEMKFLLWGKSPGFLASLLAMLLNTLACSPSQPGTQKEKSNPNIVLIVADDLGYGDLSCYGAEKISTPAIDALAEEGIKFTKAYASSSLCSPSRYSILTGRYSWRTRLKHGVLKYFDKPLINEDETTIASLLKRNGYYTACVGKWHLGLDWTVNDKAPDNPDESVFNSWAPDTYEYIDYSKPIKNGPTQRGFDYFYGMAGSNNMQPYVLIENDSVTQAPSVEQKPYDHYVAALRAPNWDIKNLNKDLTLKAVEVINNHFKTNNGKPLFLYHPTSAPHRPCLPTFTKGKSQAGLRGDVIMELDWTIQQIVQALKDNGAFENTLLIFTSDNGPRPGDPVLWLERYAEGDYEDWVPEASKNYSPELVYPEGNMIWQKGWITYGHKASGELLGFKSDAWEGGFRVPLVVTWPDKIKANSENSNLVCLSDLFATVAEVVGDTLDTNEGVDSYSFLSNLMNKGAPQIRNSLTLTGGASGAFVGLKENWKYIEPAPPGMWPETYYPNGPSKFDPQLYNLKEDTGEQHNKYSELPEKVEELKELIEEVRLKMKSEGGR